MGRTFDALQRLMKEMEGQRSSPGGFLATKTSSDAAAEKETRPMGSEYGEYPPLDMAGLRDGYKMCVENARRLIDDARTLRDAGRFRTAYLVLVLAMEELGSAVQLYEAGRSGVQDWEEWWSCYFSHPKAHGSASIEIPGAEKVRERFTRIDDDLVYVDFDKNNKRFMSPREDTDRELLELFEKEAAYAENVLKALPSHAFERWEFEEMVRQSPDIAPSVLYARIEEILQQEPAISERDLVTSIARDLGMPPEDFAAGFERWKKLSPKARAHMDLLRRVQDRLRKG